MNIIRTLIPVIFASIALTSFAGEKVDKSLSAEGVKNVSIENLRGHVSIEGWDGAEIAITGELDEETKRLVFEQNGSTIDIKVIVPRHVKNRRNIKGSRITVKVPDDIRVIFVGVSSDVSLKNLFGDTEIKTVSGSVKANNLQNNIELSSVSGNINSEDLSGKISLSSVSGNVKDKNSSGRIKLKVVSGEIYSKSKANEVFANNVSGNIELELADVDDVVVTTVSGDMESSLSLNESGVVKLSSVSGDVDVSFQQDVQARFRMHTNAGGDLVNKLTNDKAKRAKYGPNAKLNFQTGNGSGSVRANTVSGEIKFSYK